MAQRRQEREHHYPGLSKKKRKILMLRKILTAALAALGFGAALGASTASAQEWPSQPIRVVVPYAPGAGNDILSRLTAEYLTKKLGQTVFVENKPGAGSAIGCDIVAKAKPDGYTILWTASDGISLLPAVKQSLPYRVPEDFTFIAMVTDFTYLVSVNSKLPIKTLPELIAYGKANPGKLRYGTAGVGGAPHLATELMAKAAGIEMVHVPYGGVAPALAAAVGGHIDLALASPPASKPYADGGNIRPIAITDTKRHKLYPDVPTTAEAGMPSLVVTFWHGLMAPAGTPTPILTRLQNEIAGMLKDPDVIDRLDKLGYIPVYKDREVFKDFVLKDLAKWKDTAKAANISIE
jgi:tripartite-type tricarboxylate transporter receptor subunit TctC